MLVRLAPLTLFQPNQESSHDSLPVGASGRSGLNRIGPDAEDQANLTEACSLDTIQQQMERLEQGSRRLAVQLRLDLAPELLWSVLTDYGNLNRYIPNLVSSRQIWRRDHRVGLEQVGSQQFCGLNFTARVELEIEEDPSRGELRFKMICGDFRRFEGCWRVKHDGRTTQLLYELTVQGKPGMPIGLIEQRLQRDLGSNLRGVQQEAMRRTLAVK